MTLSILKSKIQFFKKIRQGLLQQNMLSKYLLYAIGEIILVMIGILLALQVNNWNSQRKLQIEEIKLLRNIQADLEVTISNLKLDSIGNLNDVLLYEKIEYYIVNDLPYSENLDSAFGRFTFWHSPYITATAYNTLQSKGLDIIKNEDLKNEIVKVYEISAKTLTNDYDETEWSLSNYVVVPFFSKFIRRLPQSSLFLSRPNDFKSLKKNEEFKNILSMLIRQRKRGLIFYKEGISEMLHLTQSIEKELNERKNN